jgi:hypothetical protein
MSSVLLQHSFECQCFLNTLQNEIISALFLFKLFINNNNKINHKSCQYQYMQGKIYLKIRPYSLNLGKLLNGKLEQ